MEHGDQIEQCVAAGKKNGIEVHVWKVNFNIGYGVPQEYIDQLRQEDRLQVSFDGEPGDWLNPAHPKNFQMELDSILPGIGISLRNKTQSADRVVGQVFLNRMVGTGGFTIFDLNERTLQSATKGLSMSAGKTKATPPHRKAE